MIKNSSIKKVVVYVLLGCLFVAVMFPIYWVVVSSFKPKAEWYAIPPVFIPSEYHFENYSAVVKQYSKNIKNSLIIASVSTICALMIGSLAAYSLSRFSYKAKNHLEFWILSTRMIPPVVFAIPLFRFMFKLGLLDTYLSMILLHTMFNLAFVVWLMKGFFAEIPKEIEESARVDGCSRFSVYWRITLPLSATGLLVVGVLCFIFSWNEFLFAVIFSRDRVATITVALATCVRDATYGIRLGWLSALLIFSLAPVMLITVVFRKHLVRGLTFGALK